MPRIVSTPHFVACYRVNTDKQDRQKADPDRLATALTHRIPAKNKAREL